MSSSLSHRTLNDGDDERRDITDSAVAYRAEQLSNQSYESQRERHTVPAKPTAPSGSEDAIALRFAERHADELRYVAAWGRWFRWIGTHWTEDTTLHVFDLVRAMCREVAAASNDKDSKALASAKTVAAVERLAKADRRLAATADQWDSDPWLLNTPNGTVDLREGLLRPIHRPADHCTKITAAASDPRLPCPTWRAFLERVTGGDADLQAFLQRVAGYSLTGDTSAHALFFLFGHGANGKSVFIDTMSGIAHDYHRTAPIETFTASSGDRHPTDLAGLRGARLVTAVETEEGRRWAESRIKALTGGDKIAARFMRQDFFEFEPQFKLLIAGNHKPGLRSVDEAIRRRFHLIPFSVTIPPNERDPELKDKLKSEWPAILAWMIEGCRQWRADGLQPPRAVQEATAAYLDAEDAVSAWADECCIVAPNEWGASSDLFASFSKWAEANGEPPASAKRFAHSLEARGFVPFRKKAARGFQGLTVDRSDEPPLQHWADR